LNSPRIVDAAATPIDTLDDALAEALRLLRAEQLTQAEALYKTILAYHPQQPDALQFLGVLRHLQGRSDESLALIQQAIEIAPQAPGIWNNLGNVFLEGGQIDEATAAYERSIAFAPGAPQAHNNLATIYRRQLRWLEAEAACRLAIAADADMADAWYNLSLILLGQGRVPEGLQANGHATLLWPRHLVQRDQILRALVLLGHLDQAAELYREWLAEDPDNPVVQHQLAACLQGDATPTRASDAYVETLFDGFAASFDAKLAKLHYRAPDLVTQALRIVAGEPQGALSMVDLGCGTGLCGPLVRPWANHLAGCDLSVGMLRQARLRQVYDVLHKAELVYYLETQPGHFDALICADTLCYFGDLQPVMQAARRSLQPGGHFIFTVEALTESNSVYPAGYKLQASGRYVHTLIHVRDCALSAGLQLACAQKEMLRDEAGQPVPGWLVTLTAPDQIAQGV
jgi:predicted TPR repeat methyltransferase